MARLQQANCASYFTTVKRLGAASEGPLWFPMPGWSLCWTSPLDALRSLGCSMISSARREQARILREVDAATCGS